MASVLQTLFSLPNFSDRYFTKGSAHSLLCTNTSPANCFECQMSKVADGLLSGRYAVPRSVDSAHNDDATAEAYTPAGSGQPETLSEPSQSNMLKPFQEGVRPIMFKALIGKDHEEFKTMRQQDSEEFLKHLIGMIQRDCRNTHTRINGSTVLDNEGSLDPTDIFKFQMEERLQCEECKGVRYKTVPEETIGVPVPFVEKSNLDGMDLDEKGKGALEGNNAMDIVSATRSNTKEPEWESVTIEECLSLLTNTATIEYKCPKCNKNVSAQK